MKNCIPFIGFNGRFIVFLPPRLAENGSIILNATYKSSEGVILFSLGLDSPGEPDLTGSHSLVSIWVAE